MNNFYARTYHIKVTYHIKESQYETEIARLCLALLQG